MNRELELLIKNTIKGDSISQEQRDLVRAKAVSLDEDPDEAEIHLEFLFAKSKSPRIVPSFSGRTTPSSHSNQGSYDFHDSGCTYEGEMKNGVAEGTGVLYYPNQYGTILYKGEFHGGNRHGRGVMFYQDGITKCYEGQWINGEMGGKGVFYREDGVTKLYEGEHQDGTFEGEGILYNDRGEKFYQGGFHNSNYHGKGIIYRNGLKLCEGDFVNGQMTRGSLYKNGLKIYNGPLPPTEEGIICPGAKAGGSIDESKLVFQDYLLSVQDNKYKS